MPNVNIKGVKYKILVGKKFLSKDNSCGEYDYKQKYIVVTKDDISQSYTLQTVIHELFHAFLRECGLIVESNDEDLVTWFDTQFIYIFFAFLDVVNILFPKYKHDIEEIKTILQKMNNDKISERKKVL